MSMTATYSPDDNKLRLYSTARLDAETYQRLKDAGFRWAPKQDLFVAPMWTPEREDILLALCGEIDDEDTSLADRAEERADRFEDYSDKRASEAEVARACVKAITAHIPFGQPILVGHHSERRARKDAERIENGMRRAVKLWDTSDYWKRRAAGALRHAKYKERNDVRCRRIKGIEADKRKRERMITEAEVFLKLWQREGLTQDRAVAIANRDHIYHCFPLAEYPREVPASQYEGSMGLWSALTDRVITAEQARDIAVRVHENTIAYARRWIAHYENRLHYERGLLEESGGIVGNKFEIQVGGKVLVGREWLVVVRVNKSGGQIQSVTTNGRYGRIKSIVEIADYKAPEAGDVERVKAATQKAPLCNYPVPDCVEMTAADWKRKPKDYALVRTVKATETHGEHRARFLFGHNGKFTLKEVFITDAKRVDPPALAEAAPKVGLPVPERIVEAPRTQPPAPVPTEFDAMRQQLRQGVAVVNAPQLFPTPPELAEKMVDLANLEIGMRVLEPSAGNGAILSALPGVVPFGPQRQTALEVVAVEVNPALAAMLEKSGLAHTVKCGDFLQCNGDLGTFDRALLNPPFENGQDIQHIKHALKMLKPGGRLVAICANGPRQQDQLRPLVEGMGGAWEPLPSNTFKPSGTSVNAALIVLDVH